MQSLMLILCVRKGQKLNTLHDVIPPHMSQTYPPTQTEGRPFPPGFQLNSADSEANLFLEHSRRQPLNSEPIHLEHSVILIGLI